MVVPNNASEFVKQIHALTDDLIEALNNSDEARIQKDQQAFSIAIERAWQYFNRPEVPAREKAIPRLIEGWAQRDLMTEVSDPANRQKAVRDLKLFLNGLALFE
jgi:hypothetical protein